MKYFRQLDENTCGVCCILTILKLFKINGISASQVIEMTKTDNSGTNLYGMVDGLQKLGFATDAYKGSFDELIESVNSGKTSLPCIINTYSEYQGMHYTIIEKINNDNICIFDPARGKKKVSREELKELYTGYVIALNKVSSPRICAEKTQKLSLLKHHKISILITVLLSLTVAAIGIIGTMVFELVIDKPTSIDIKTIVLSLIILFLLQGILEGGRTIISARLSKNIDTVLHTIYNRAISFLPSQKLRIKTTGDYLARYNELVSIRDAASSIVLVMFVDGIIVLGSSIVLFNMNQKMFFANIIMTLVYLIIIVFFKTPISKLQNNLMEKSAVCEGYIKECIDGEETVKMANAQEYIYKRQMNNSSLLIKGSYKANIIEKIQGILISTLDNIGLIIILGIGVACSQLGIMTMGEVIAFYSLSAFFSEPLKNIASLQSVLQEGRVAKTRLFDVIGLTQERLSGNSFTENIEDIRLNNITFRYGNNEAIIENLSMSISGKQKVAIMGHSGSGKTTLIKLLEGLYKPESGDVLINGKSLYDYSLSSYRSSIGVINQDCFLFSDTIKENLLLGRDINDQEIVEVCKKCNIHKFIESLPFGYNTPLDENGKNLSGGQKQRLCVARALLGKPKLLIMDEGTANLDKESERIIVDIIKQMNIPCIVITHKQSVADMCDCIYHLKQGRMYI